jgi:hypothetical protein
MMKNFGRALAAAVVLSLSPERSGAADLVALSPQTWAAYAPAGKEADAIYGDFALVNDQLVAVVAHPKVGRHANMTVRDAGGCLIDLTRRDRQSDQLSAFYPGAGMRHLRFAGVAVEKPEIYEASELDRVFVRARRVALRLVALPQEQQPDVEVVYTLEDGWPYVQVTTTFTNRGSLAVSADLVDGVRADNTFDRCPDPATPLYWFYDKHFGQAYGVSSEAHEILPTAARMLLLRYRNQDGGVSVRLAPGESYRLERRLIPAANLFALRSTAARLGGSEGRPPRLRVVDSAGRPVVGAEVTLERDGKPHAWGRTDEEGQIELVRVGEPALLTITALGHGSTSLSLGADAPALLTAQLPEAGGVVARIVDESGNPIPCKVQFLGRDGTPTPDFGPDSGEHTVKNLYYSHDGRFRQPLEPGSYDVIISYGPEHDAVFTKIEVVRGRDTPLEATLVRSVKTTGWVSADFHSHSSPSGDNTASQLGRVLNLLCEHIEFAPCTEHNRLSSYDPHLQALGAEGRMATCVGIELTGIPLPLNHQNAFPLVMQPHTQDGGAPPPDLAPEIQIERLAFWDGGSEKLIQVNHPDLGWMFRDRNGDGQPDKGFTRMIERMDVIEVHPPHLIFGTPKFEYQGRLLNVPIFNWLQLLNQGHRFPGVVNTDAHYNFHGSGWLRNYLKSPTDDPAAIETLDIVRAAERGQLVMTNGPFLEVAMRAAESSTEAGPGDDLVAADGRATLHVRVQCPNWFDIDRVQVFLNGRPIESLNFTRRADPERFAAGAVRFDQEIPLALERDTHVIVAAIGEQSRLGDVMGPDHAADLPVAVSNPIFVDVDGGGFKANGDPLGELPVKAPGS